MRRSLLAVSVALLACSSRDRATAPATSPAAARTALQVMTQVRASHHQLAALGLAKHSRALPSSADAAVRIGADPARAVWVRALDVAPVPAKVIDRAHVFADAALGMDLVLGDDGERFEEARVLRDERAARTARWQLTTGEGITAVRVREATVEAIDARGKVVVRSGRIFFVDARHVERDARLTVEKRGDGWIVTATLDTAGMTYPIVLDPLWLPGPTMTISRGTAAMARAADGKVYIACGDIQFGNFDVFDPATDSITEKAMMPDPWNDCFGTIASDGKFIVLGGGKVRIYDPVANSWSAGAAAGAAVDEAAWAVLADGKILRAGGQVSDYPVSSAEIYDPVANTWSTTTADLKLRARRGAKATAIPGNAVIVIGGRDGTTLSTTEIYDVGSNTWSAGPDMAAPREKFGFGVAGGKAIVIGGSNGSSSTSTSEILDLAVPAFTAGGSVVDARSDITVVAGPEGALAIGGSQFSESSFAKVDFSPSPFSAFTVLPPMAVARQRPAALRLADGRVFVAGGLASFSPLDSTEILSALPNGAACAWKGECISGFCASGVCCNAACTSECQRCNNVGSEGTCGAAPAAVACGAAAACTGSTLTPRGACAGGTATTCTAATGAACAGGLVCADATRCLTKCAQDADCTTTRCDVATGLCLPALVDSGVADTGGPDTLVADTAPPEDTLVADTGGFLEDAGIPPIAPVPEGAPKVVGSAQLCKGPSDCTTGFCVDGVCCDSPCTDRCHSCVLPGSPGRCTESPVGVDLRAECGPALSCAGTCGKGGVCTTSVQGSQCAASTCTGPSSGKGAAYCKSTGAPCGTADAVPFDCGAYACEAAFGACRTSCNTSDNCAPGFVCDTASKSCASLPAEEDSGCATTSTGTRGVPASALGFLVALAALGRVRRRTHR